MRCMFLSSSHRSFDVDTHPQSSFVLTRAESQGDQATLTGNLALHGVTNHIQFPADPTI